MKVSRRVVKETAILNKTHIMRDTYMMRGRIITPITLMLTIIPQKDTHQIERSI